MINTLINDDCFNILSKIEDNSIDCILTDPPYLISRESGFKNYSENANSELKSKYGNISIDFGDWDKNEIDWNLLFSEYYRVLKKGGTLIFFFDVWKSTIIKEVAELNKFKQPRVCQFIKKNPVPINSKTNYLSNAIEFFFTFTKVSKPTFNSEYDTGIYTYPICHGKERTKHPTQKPIALIEEIILKHSNEGDLILDTFGGSGTTANACIKTKRNFISIEMNKEYYDISVDRINKIVNVDLKL